jgi:hypothetical protein
VKIVEPIIVSTEAANALSQGALNPKCGMPSWLSRGERQPQQDTQIRARSLTQFQNAFSDEVNWTAFERRRLEGFVSPACRTSRCVVEERAHSYECHTAVQEDGNRNATGGLGPSIRYGPKSCLGAGVTAMHGKTSLKGI